MEGGLLKAAFFFSQTNILEQITTLKCWINHFSS